MSVQPIGSRTAFERLPGGGYAYVLVDEPLRIEFRHLHVKDHRLYAEVDVQCEWAGVPREGPSLSCALLDCSSQTARRALAKHCQERAKTKPGDFDWMKAIDSACILAIRADREGEAPIVLDDALVREDRNFEVCGLQVPADAASMLIAHGDSLKSLVLLYVLGTFARTGQRVLYLDWEWSGYRHLQRKRRLFGPERLEGLHYLRCRAALTIETDRIRRYCDQHGITFLGGDSVGLACDGKLADDDTAIRFHRALGLLPASLWAAHVPKASVNPDVKTDPIGPFGSVFFSNLCRASWLVKKQPGASDDLVSVGLFPQKQNDGERRRPIGLEFSFAADLIAVRTVDLAGVDGLAEKLPLAVRMTHLLKRGPLTFAQLATELDAKLDSVIKAGTRGKAFTKVVGSDGVQRLALVERQVA